MPCYQTQTCNCNLNNADIDLLQKALEAQGFNVWRVAGNKSLGFSKAGVTGTYSNNKLNFSYSGEKPDTDAIKREYSKAVIEQKAAQYAEEGWEVEKDGDEWVFNRPSSGYGAVFA